MAGTGYGLGTRLERLETTNESRTLVGMAIGILMERKHLDREGAFEVLHLASSESLLKLGQVAALVITETEHQDPNADATPDALVVTPAFARGPRPVEISIAEAPITHHA
ncbi:MAG: hypothetical protein QOH26_94 [Actinomycetota bacterium]|nr:hypothetical protein [Actinomycetota bacterium]